MYYNHLGLEFEVSRAILARLAKARSTNELAQLNSINKRVQNWYLAWLGKLMSNLWVARLAQLNS
jgi:hypothetical protein